MPRLIVSFSLSARDGGSRSLPALAGVLVRPRGMPPAVVAKSLWAKDLAAWEESVVDREGDA